MGIIEESVQELEIVIEGSGCEDGAVTLRRNPGAANCQYEHGVCLEALYGGRSGEFVTSDPVEATTKISFLFGTTLKNNPAKSAACAVLNVISAFLCLSRRIRACPASAHPACLASFKERFNGKQVFLVGECSLISREFGTSLTQDPENAAVIVINNEGLLEERTAEIVAMFGNRKEILCIGPSTAGVAGLKKLERFCPYGT